MTKKQLIENCGTLSKPGKMPGFGFGLSAHKCITGAKLAKVDNTVCNTCYALGANYSYPSVKQSHETRLSKVQNLELWQSSMIQLIARETARIKVPYFRFFDSGDLQSPDMLTAIINIARALPKINFWLPTKEYTMIKNCTIPIPDNLAIRVSNPYINAIYPQGKFELTSSVLTKDKTHLAGFLCPAPKQNNACLNCRACWDKSIKDISYNKH